MTLFTQAAMLADDQRSTWLWENDDHRKWRDEVVILLRSIATLSTRDTTEAVKRAERVVNRTCMTFEDAAEDSRACAADVLALALENTRLLKLIEEAQPYRKGMEAKVADAELRTEALALQVAQMRAALEPFRDWIIHRDGLANGTRVLPDEYRIGGNGPTLGQFRATISALAAAASPSKRHGNARDECAEIFETIAELTGKVPADAAEEQK